MDFPTITHRTNNLERLSYLPILPALHRFSSYKMPPKQPLASFLLIYRYQDSLLNFEGYAVLLIEKRTL